LKCAGKIKCAGGDKTKIPPPGFFNRVSGVPTSQPMLGAFDLKYNFGYKKPRFSRGFNKSMGMRII